MTDQFEHAKRSIRNFDVVTPWLYRGGQPGKQGLEALQQLGVKTIISLRWADKEIEPERKACEQLGINFISIRLNYWNVPNTAKIDQFFNLIDKPETHPVFIHCFHGADRTGLMVAMYRITHEGWNFARAYAEMKAHGFHRFRIRNFKWVLWRYAARHPGMAKLWWFTEAP